jgi:hypothetical protein
LRLLSSISLVLALTLLGLTPRPAQAAPATQAAVTVQVKVSAGGMSITSNGGAIDFGAVSVANSGQPIPAISVVSLNITDSTGTARGWNVTFQASDLTDGTGLVPASTGLHFSPSGGTVTAVSGQPIDGTNGPRETNIGTQSLATPVRVLSANAGYGQGSYTYTPSANSLTLTLPVGLQIGTGNFTGTLTATVQSGP